MGASYKRRIKLSVMQCKKFHKIFYGASVLFGLLMGLSTHMWLLAILIILGGIVGFICFSDFETIRKGVLV